MKAALVSALLLFSTFPSFRTSLAQAPANGQPFSRSAWIRARMNSVRFSGGVLPSNAPTITPPAINAQTEALSIQSIPPATVLTDIVSTPPIQASRDLIPSDFLAQPATHTEPYIDANPRDSMNLVGGWQENRFQSGGARCLSYGTSLDGGQTWTTNLIPHLTTFDGGVWDRASDPWVAFGPNNQVYYASLLFNETTPDNAVGVSLSTDGGQTWGHPVEINHTTRLFNDKDAIAADTFPDSPGFGNVYVAWDVNNSRNRQWVVVVRSTDGGATFSPTQRLGKKGIQNIGAIPRVGPDGTVYVVWLGSNSGTCNNAFFISSSRDGGATWSKKHLVTQACPSGVKGLRTGDGLPSFAVNPATGFLYVAWQDFRFDSAGNVGHAVMTTSTDRGRTWSTPVRISDGPADAPVFTVAVATTADQQVAVNYYSLQNDPARQFLVDEYVRVSVDGGVTFAPSIRVTPSSFDIRKAAVAGQGLPFLGDYQGLTGSSGSRGVPGKFNLLWIATPASSQQTGKAHPASNPVGLGPEAFTSATH